MILVNGQPEETINVLDRGLQYGDGLFETIAFRNGQAEFLQTHLNRLYSGCKRLKITTSQLDVMLEKELEQVCSETIENAVIKIIITRGQGGRGYRTQTDIHPTRIISTHDLPEHPLSNHSGICARLCEQSVAESASLAGIKHLNRLEQVLARAEWSDDKLAEGLMFDLQQYLIEGTMSNVFIVKEGNLLTPSLTMSGVAGIMRQQVINIALQENIDIKETQISKHDLLHADEVFITNSLIDIWPIIEIENFSTYEYGAVTALLQDRVNSLTR